MRLSVMMPWLVALVLLGLGGCSRVSTPQDAYRFFHQKVRKGELREAWGVLSKPTQDALAERARAVGEASGVGLRRRRPGRPPIQLWVPPGPGFGLSTRSWCCVGSERGCWPWWPSPRCCIWWYRPRLTTR